MLGRTRNTPPCKLQFLHSVRTQLATVHNNLEQSIKEHTLKLTVFDKLGLFYDN